MLDESRDQGRHLRPRKVSGLKGWLPLLLWLGGCCLEESPGIVAFADRVEADLERACQVSSLESLSFTALTALSVYLGELTRPPSSKEGLCLEYYGTACQFEHPCEEKPDLGGPDPCPPKEAPPRRYHACFGCGGPATPPANFLKFDGRQLDLLDRVVKESGARSREEALHRAILFYEQIWVKKRQKPDFFQHAYNLPPERKHNEPCRYR